MRVCSQCTRSMIGDPNPNQSGSHLTKSFSVILKEGTEIDNVRIVVPLKCVVVKRGGS
jgi:hypothetical protein